MMILTLTVEMVAVQPVQSKLVGHAQEVQALNQTPALQFMEIQKLEEVRIVMMET